MNASSDNYITLSEPAKQTQAEERGRRRRPATARARRAWCGHAKCETWSKGKEAGRTSSHTTGAEQMLLWLWLEKTVLAPTCAISSLLILTITVRRTRWSVGRRVLRVVTQAYQGDEETRLTEPGRHRPPNPLTDFKRGAHLRRCERNCAALAEALRLCFLK